MSDEKPKVLINIDDASETVNETFQLNPCLSILIRLAAITFCILPLWVVAQPVVPAFDRFPNDTPAAQIAGGEALINELNCIACHTTDQQQSNRFESRPAPVLFTTQNSTSAGWLKRWLDDPHNLKPGTIMPDLLHGLDQKAKAHAIDALRHYLVSLTPPLGEQAVFIGDSNKGKKLYQTIGCAQCHSPDAKDNGMDVPLGELHQKYTQAQLIQFLLNPLHSRPAGRMPRVPMTQQEAEHLTIFLLNRGPLRKDAIQAKGSDSLKLREEGKVLYQKLRCSNCHSTRDSNVLPNVSKSLSKLELTQGCLSAKPPKEAPHFHLNAKQTAAITAALKAKPGPLTAQERTHHRMRQLNCSACHARDGLGKPDPTRDPLFTSTGNDLGDEGRLPPILTGVGAKLTEPALHNVLRGKDVMRPYMTTRMPDFGEAHAKFLVRHLIATDARANVKPTPRDGQENNVGRNQYGRELMGIKGLNCITCHQLGGHKSLGIQAIDLAHSPNRLRPEWFRDYLINPAHFRPGTRMPSFWPNGKAVSPIFGRNTERQIDSIWVYLNEFKQTRLPEGLEKKGGFELKPDKRPIVFRTFMEGVGTHAIAIGYPAGIHAAFDSEQVRWALMWRGKFLDAESTWDDRFTPLTPPLGKNVVTLGSGPAVAILKNLKQPWPKDGLQMQGYRLAKDGTPILLYSHGTTTITDALTPRGKGMRRQMEFTGTKSDLWVRLATAKVFLNDKPGIWSTDSELSIIAPTAQFRRIGETSELIAPVKFDESGKATIEMEWHWQ
jgi:mono/diheme cytochrome c family protein